MKIVNRLIRIETSLTPKQTVLLWLSEAQQDDFGTFMKKIHEARAEEQPRIRVPEMAAKSVRENLDLKAMTPYEAQCAVREARRQADFLVVLALGLFSMLDSECLVATLCLALLRRTFEVLRVNDGAPPNQVGWDAWRDLLKVTLARVWRIDDATGETLYDYFDGLSILPAGMHDRLSRCLNEAEGLADRYNALEGRLPGWTAFDLAGLRCSVDMQGTALVEAMSGRAEDEVLKALGPARAPWDLQQFRTTERTR